jgi:uncharacterized protein YcaQ
MGTSLDLSLAEARRLALSAQGFDGRSRARAPSAQRLSETLARLRLLQIDSVSVLVRAHYLPLFSRRGPYDRAFLDRLAYEERAWFEGSGHAASLLPARLEPLLRWRAERRPWPAVARILRRSPSFAEGVLRRIAEEGPLTASDLAGEGPRPRGMWNWGPAKHVVEWFFATGRLAVAGRRGFERRYDLSERVLPADVLRAPTPTKEDAQAALLLESAEALGVATLADLADYFRLRVPAARPLVARLVEDGRLSRVRVEGWKADAYVPSDVARAPRSVSARALLSPFDSLVFRRDRTERLFAFRYRIGIYTPAAKREHGYYVLPFLHDEALRARVDLKADRATGRLLVRRAFLEPGERAGPVADALAEELRLVARWLDLARVVVESRGAFGAAVRRRVQSSTLKPRLSMRDVSASKSVTSSP